MSWETFLLGICWLMAAGGIFFVVVGAIGILRAPDVYTRIHAASVTDTGSASLYVFALCLYGFVLGYDIMVMIKLFLTYFFIMFTGPTASHAVAKTALMNELNPIDKDGNEVICKDLLDSKLLKSNRKD